MRPYAGQVGGLLSIGSLCGILMNTAVVLPAVLLGHAIDTVLGHQRGTVDGSAVGTAVVWLVAGTVATELPRIGKRVWLGTGKNRIAANVRADAFGGVLSWPADRLHSTAVGEVMARIVGDVEVLGTGVGEVLVETWDTLLFSVSLVVAMLIYDPALGAVAVVPVVPALILAKAVGARVSTRTVRARAANAAVTTFVQEGLSGLRVLRVSGRGLAYTARLRGLAHAQADAELAVSRLDAVLAPIYTTLVTGGVVAVVWLGGQRVADGVLSVGDLVAFLGLFGRFTARAFRIPQMANRVQAAAAAYGRLAPLLAAPPAPATEPPHAGWRRDRIAGLPWPETTGATRPPIATTNAHSPNAHSSTAAIGPIGVRLSGVTFSYPGAACPALRGVSLRIPPGAVVAVTGPVGSGKSALARVVLGLYPTDDGQVLVDGTDPATWQAGDRARVGYLPQGHPVFSGTIAENVLLPDIADRGDDRDVSLQRTGDLLDEVLSVAGLREDVAAMPEGAGTTIGELGVRVSGGQRQRLALARALGAPAAAPGLLVLDDPFSAVDVDTEARIIAALRDAVGPHAAPGRRATVLVCSTRLAAFVHADLVVVLDRGRVREHGTHTALLAADGLYARIFRAQQHSAGAPSEGPVPDTSAPLWTPAVAPPR